MDIGLIGKCIAGAVAGLGLIWFIWKRIGQGEQDRASLSGEKAFTQGKAEADDAQRVADKAAQGAKDAAGQNPLDW